VTVASLITNKPQL